MLVGKTELIGRENKALVFGRSRSKLNSGTGSVAGGAPKSDMIADRFFATQRILAVLHFAGGLVLFAAAQAEEFSQFLPLILLYFFCYMAFRTCPSRGFLQ